MESTGHAYNMIEEAKSNHNICNKAGFTFLLCKLFRTKDSNNSKLHYQKKYDYTCPSVHKFCGL